MLPVSEPFLPPLEDYTSLIAGVWDRRYLTNNGPLVIELENKLERYLDVDSLFLVSNGTLALQLSLRALQIEGEVITSPFSFVATSTSILWENCKPVFVDINSETLCIDVEKIEEAITENTKAILATHVFGIPCDVGKIDEVAKKHQLKVIYDAAHAFGVTYNGKSLLRSGDISVLSFHATKVFHTVEGGAIINNYNEGINNRIELLRNFGYKNENHKLVGINAKNSEFHAAMGLCNLKYIGEIIRERKKITELYDSLLLKSNKIKRPKVTDKVEYNYAYYPVILESETKLLEIKQALEKIQIQSRRYFNPSLNNLPYLDNYSKCPISEDISARVLCIPLFYGLKMSQVELISQTILERI